MWIGEPEQRFLKLERGCDGPKVCLSVPLRLVGVGRPDIPEGTVMEYESRFRIFFYLIPK